jgi:hypothetical protein
MLLKLWRYLVLGLLTVTACEVRGWAPDRTTGFQSDVGSPTVALNDAGVDEPARSTCRGHAVRPVGPGPSGDDPVPPSCLVGEDGSLTMSYVTSSCPDVRPYRGCEISKRQDLSAFDAGQGVWQAEVCLDGAITDTINVWYEVSNGPRKYFNLAQPGAAGGCRTVFISPLDSCLGSGTCGPRCPTVKDEPAGSDGGCLEFTDSTLLLMSEWCVCPSGGCPPPSKVTIKLLSLSYLSNDCLCSGDTDCTESQKLCRKDAWPDGAGCKNTTGGCRGVCLP